MVDPFSLSLLSLGVSSLAIRRIVQAVETREAEAKAVDSRTALARKLLLHAIAETALRDGRGEYAEVMVVLSGLIATEEYAELTLDTNVSLEKVFELEGDKIDEVSSILSRRHVEAVIYDKLGMPVAALCEPKGKAGPPPLIRRLFKLTNLPIVSIPAELDWRETMSTVEEAFGLGDKAGISSIRAA